MRASFILIAFCALSSIRADAQELRNWFNDPFLTISSTIPNCPEPAGPRMIESERLAQSHRRAEKGTSCWLAGDPDCPRSNAYTFDQEISESIKAGVGTAIDLSNSSLWVTVQGRVVYIEGCVLREEVAQELEAYVRKLPHVQSAVPIVAIGSTARVPYRTLPKVPEW